MKIGILTQPLHRNYGGILQNWALQQVLIHMGHKPEMIFLCGNSRPCGKLLVMRCMSFSALYTGTITDIWGLFIVVHP